MINKRRVGYNLCLVHLRRGIIDIFFIKFHFYIKKQKCGNYHPFWDRLCFCLEGENDNEIIDLKTGEQYKRKGK